MKNIDVHSIKTKLILSFFIFITIPLIFASYITYHMSYDATKQSNEKFVSEEIKVKAEQTATIFNNINNISMQLFSNVHVQSLLNGNLSEKKNVDQIISDIIDKYPYISSIQFNRGRISNSKQTHNSFFWDFDGQHFFLTRSIESLTDNSRKIGFIRITVDSTYILSALKGTDGMKTLSLFNQKGDNILHPIGTIGGSFAKQISNGTFGTFDLTFNKEDYFVFYSSISNTPYIMVAFIPFRSFLGGLMEVQKEIFFFIFFTIVTMILIATVLSLTITRPLFSLIDSSKKSKMEI